MTYSPYFSDVFFVLYVFSVPINIFVCEESTEVSESTEAKKPTDFYSNKRNLETNAKI